MAKFGLFSTVSSSTSSTPSFNFAQPSPVAPTAPPVAPLFGYNPNSTPASPFESAHSPFGSNAGLFNSTPISSTSVFGTPGGSTGLFGSAAPSPFGSNGLFGSNPSSVPSMSGSFSTGEFQAGSSFGSRNSTNGPRKVVPVKRGTAKPVAPSSNSLFVSSGSSFVVGEVPDESKNVEAQPTGHVGDNGDDVQGVSSSSTPPITIIVTPGITSLTSEVHHVCSKSETAPVVEKQSMEKSLTENLDSQNEVSECMKPVVEKKSTEEVVTETSDSKRQCDVSECLKPEAASLMEKQSTEEAVFETPGSKHQSEVSVCLKPEVEPVAERQTSEEIVIETSGSKHQSEASVCLKLEATTTIAEVVNGTSNSEHQSALSACLEPEAAPLETQPTENVVKEASYSEHGSEQTVCLDPEVAPAVETQSTIEYGTPDSHRQYEASGRNGSSLMSPESLIPLELALSSQKTRSVADGPILQQILRKYGDITRESTLKSWEAKAVFVQLVVEVVEVLNARTIDTIDAEEIQKMQKWTDDAAAVGFHVGWLQQRIKDIVANSKYQELMEHFDKISEQIDAAKVALLEMERKQMALKKEMDELKADKEMDDLCKSKLSEGLF